MSVQENTSIARRFIQFWGKRTFDIMDGLAAPSL